VSATESNPLVRAHVDLEVQFHDADPMGVTWHGNYFRYLEAARSALLTKLRYNYADMQISGYRWPIVDAQIKYLRPTTYGQRLRVAAELTEYENRLRIAYTITDLESGEVVTRAQTTQVAIGADDGEMLFCSPQILLDKVRACRDST
jgi:acyl-CoA thioester hydrolase